MFGLIDNNFKDWYKYLGKVIPFVSTQIVAVILSYMIFTRPFFVYMKVLT